MTLPELLKARRNEMGLTQRELAEKLGKNFQTYQRWESGQFKPSLANVHLISEKMDIELNVLIETYSK
jgi:transcriptional regulator with XRE-family HTH domain